MKRIILILIMPVLAILLLQSCLTVEKKEYSIKLTGQMSGSAKIRYINIASQKDDGRDVSLKDFGELITDYLEGKKIDEEYPDVSNIDKKLYEENGVLVGEVTFDFDSLTHVKLFKYDKDSPYMCLVKEAFNSEEYESSNGDYGGEKMPVLFWPKNQKEFKWTNVVSKDMNETVGLVNDFKDWQKRQKNK